MTYERNVPCSRSCSTSTRPALDGLPLALDAKELAEKRRDLPRRPRADRALAFCAPRGYLSVRRARPSTSSVWSASDGRSSAVRRQPHPLPAAGRHVAGRGISAPGFTAPRSASLSAACGLRVLDTIAKLCGSLEADPGNCWPGSTGSQEISSEADSKRPQKPASQMHRAGIEQSRQRHRVRYLHCASDRSPRGLNQPLPQANTPTPDKLRTLRFRAWAAPCWSKKVSKGQALCFVTPTAPPGGRFWHGFAVRRPPLGGAGRGLTSVSAGRNSADSKLIPSISASSLTTEAWNGNWSRRPSSRSAASPHISPSRIARFATGSVAASSPVTSSAPPVVSTPPTSRTSSRDRDETA